MNLSGVTLVGWIVAVLGFAGLYGAITNETWLSVVMRTIDPKMSKQRIT